MLLKTMDKLLDQLFKKTPNYDSLNRLESDVWRQIRRSKSAASAMSLMLPVWSNVNLRYASITLALVGGLFVSQYAKQPQHESAFGLEVFSPNTSFIMTSNFNSASLVRL